MTAWTVEHPPLGRVDLDGPNSDLGLSPLQAALLEMGCSPEDLDDAVAAEAAALEAMARKRIVMPQTNDSIKGLHSKGVGYFDKAPGRRREQIPQQAAQRIVTAVEHGLDLGSNGGDYDPDTSEPRFPGTEKT